MEGMHRRASRMNRPKFASIDWQTWVCILIAALGSVAAYLNGLIVGGALGAGVMSLFAHFYRQLRKGEQDE